MVRLATRNPQQDVSVAGFTNTVGFCQGDVVPDGKVDVNDMIPMAENWLSTELKCDFFVAADLTVDCQVDIKDFALLGAAWMLEHQE